MLAGVLAFALASSVSMSAAAGPAAGVDPVEAVERIKREGSSGSRVMAVVEHLADVIGPRLTNSPQFREAARWSRATLAAWGLAGARIEPWGTFGRGWSLRRFSAQVLEPQVIPLAAHPRAWSPGTPGEVVADVVLVDPARLDAHRGTLRGRIVLASPPVDVKPLFAPRATRWTDADLAQFASDAPYPPHNDNFAPPPSPEAIAARQREAAVVRLAVEEGAALIVSPSTKGDAGVVAAGAALLPEAAGAESSRALRPWQPGAPATVPQIVVSVEHYNRLVRMARRGDRVRVAVDLGVQFHDEDLAGTNTLAEIPGSDLAHETVMIGAHLDSWHAGAGATDNAAGVAVAMEAVRIIQAAGLRPRRTIRIALWGGHEQGGGSGPWIARHLTGPPRTPAYDHFSVYVNVDAGTGRFRGVYLFGNEALRPIVRPWLEPFRAMGASVLTLNSDWGSDFINFDDAGLPVISFIQDEIELETVTHHTNQDVLERVLPDDLRQAAVIASVFLYQAAMRDEKLPRKAR